MSKSYYDIIRYALEQDILFQGARDAIAELGWSIQKETENSIIAAISLKFGSTCSQITLRILTGYIEGNCQSEVDLTMKKFDDCKYTVNLFFYELDNQLDSLPV